MATALQNMVRALVTRGTLQARVAPVPGAPVGNLTTIATKLIGIPVPVLRASVPSSPAPASSPPVATLPAEKDDHSCGGRCGSLPSPSTPATAGGPGATPTALPAPSLSLTTVGSSQLPPPAGSVLAKDSATPPTDQGQQLGAWLQKNGGLWLWVIVAIVLIAVLAPSSGRRTSW